ncbi:hypothetical protein JY651_16215 [Pyxidicoccus parkwayensis]|uniref:Uncharacterized protein n=1 Tax=Pyxidicoccus parkwayensis TaxID=2813578 RepID=A0ABX7P7C1_9BACT|nr:hypothetical protein [Pyxidicoccus parkwaysis]QSQ26380.1 hypothetical protein JY651_16215 [Pyxidicoccus parkwaysis]
MDLEADEDRAANEADVEAEPVAMAQADSPWPEAAQHHGHVDGEAGQHRQPLADEEHIIRQHGQQPVLAELFELLQRGREDLPAQPQPELLRRLVMAP